MHPTDLMETASRVSLVAIASVVHRLTAANTAEVPKFNSRSLGRPARGAMETLDDVGWHKNTSSRVSRAAIAAADLHIPEDTFFFCEYEQAQRKG